MEIGVQTVPTVQLNVVHRLYELYITTVKVHVDSKTLNELKLSHHLVVLNTLQSVAIQQVQKPLGWLYLKQPVHHYILDASNINVHP